MSLAEWVAAAQATGGQSQTANTPGSMYFIIALVAVVLGLVVLIFVRSSARRSSKR
jgi:hypothetical protein